MRHEPLSGGFWMRRVSFAGLLRILHILADHPSGMRATDLNEAVTQSGAYLTKSASPPSKTTLYHCRNTLFQLHAVQRRDQRYVVNSQNPGVRALLQEPMPLEDHGLTPAAREAFAALVLANPDCKRHFFDLFMPDCQDYTVTQFRRTAASVTWRRVRGQQGVLLARSEDRPVFRLSSPSHIRSILYGVRYWARDELRLIDEYTKAGLEIIMYALSPAPDDQDLNAAVQDILSWPRSEDDEWTTISLWELLECCCQARRRPRETLFAAIAWLAENHADHMMLILTSRSFAALTARSRQREELELGSYFRDNQGRYISHIRIHRDLTGE